MAILANFIHNGETEQSVRDLVQGYGWIGESGEKAVEGLLDGGKVGHYVTWSQGEDTIFSFKVSSGKVDHHKITYTYGMIRNFHPRFRGRTMDEFLRAVGGDTILKSLV
ncbi:MAG: hypothetical protein L0207_03665 [Chlamydiae bacterium]|nr:hypothetical protein [Chlamydiota bacterium]